MKIWEILKEENVGKKYKCSNGKIYKIDVNDNDEAIICLDEDNFMEAFYPHELLSSEFEEIKPKATGWERIKVYYYVGDNCVIHYGEYGVSTNNDMFKNYNYFSTKEKAMQVRDMNLLQRMMIKFYDENDGKVDWTDTENEKYNIYYDYEYNSWETTWTYTTRQLNQIYFSTEELAQRCIDEVVKPFMEGK